MLHAWLHHVLPASFFEIGPYGLMWWQWAAIPALAVVALLVGRPLGAVTRGLLQRLFKRTRTTWDDRLLARLGPMLTLVWAVALFRITLPLLDLGDDAARNVAIVLSAVFVVATFWALWRSIDVLTEIVLERTWAHGNASARSLITVAGNFVKAAVVVIGVVSTVAAFGYPVATALAGLGIGGIALAFGAQKTVENLFGSVALATDQPFRVGDTVKVEDVTGTVERIGMRSTHVRTPDRTLVTFPNGRLADMRIETFGVRDRIRFATTIGILYGTSEAQVTRVVTGMEKILRAHPKTWKETVVVRLAGLAQAALDIEVICWFETVDPDEFGRYRQEVLLGFIRVVEEAGTRFAAPIRLVHQTAPPGAPGPPS